MKNQGFEIKLNGEPLCRAGFEAEYFVTNCILTSLSRQMDPGRETELYVGGLDTLAEQSSIWMKQNLKTGDQIFIEVVEGNFDPPAKISQKDPKELVLQEKIKYFHQLKEELREYL